MVWTYFLGVKMTSKSKWRQAEHDFEDSFDRYGKQAWCFRLSDTAAAKAIAGNKAFTVAQPSDYIVVVNGQVIFAEVKSTVDKTTFHFSNLRKTQVAASRRITAAGGTYLFFVKSEELEQWYAIPAAVVHTTLREKKSMTWLELEPYQYDL